MLVLDFCLVEINDCDVIVRIERALARSTRQLDWRSSSALSTLHSRSVKDAIRRGCTRKLARVKSRVRYWRVCVRVCVCV